MKKIFGLLFLVFIMNGCDDGDATVDAITFDDTNALNCGQLVYKITENRAMIIKFNSVASIAEAFVNDPGVRTKSVGTDASVIYRVYNGAVIPDALCATPPPIYPSAVLEWPASKGTIEVTTSSILSEPNPETGQTKINKYRHRIIFKGLELNKPDGSSQIYNEYVLGNFETNPTNTLPFSFEADQVKLCPSNTTLYNAQNSGAEGLYIQNLDPALLDTSVLNTPKTKIITDTENVLIYRLLAGSIPSGQNENYFCSGSDNPAVKEEWRGVGGANGLNAAIEVITTTNSGSGFLHTIRLKNVTFRKGNSTFFYGYDMLYGELLTN